MIMMSIAMWSGSREQAGRRSGKNVKNGNFGIVWYLPKYLPYVCYIPFRKKRPLIYEIMFMLMAVLRPIMINPTNDDKKPNAIIGISNVDLFVSKDYHPDGLTLIKKEIQSLLYALEINLREQMS